MGDKVRFYFPEPTDREGAEEDICLASLNLVQLRLIDVFVNDRHERELSGESFDDRPWRTPCRIKGVGSGSRSGGRAVLLQPIAPAEEQEEGARQRDRQCSGGDRSPGLIEAGVRDIHAVVARD